MYVCTYAHTHTYIFMRSAMYVCMYVCAYAHTHTHTFPCMYSCVHISCIHVFIAHIHHKICVLHIRTHTHTFPCMYSCIHNSCVHVCIAHIHYKICVLHHIHLTIIIMTSITNNVVSEILECIHISNSKRDHVINWNGCHAQRM